MKEELKPCPFCGGTMKIDEDGYIKHAKYIDRSKCLLAANLYAPCDLNLWNTRANSIDGKAVRELRIKAGLSLRKCAKQIGICCSYLSKIENGKVERGSIRTIRKIQSVLQENV